MDRIAEISYYLSNCIDAIKPVVDDNFVFVFFCLSKAAKIILFHFRRGSVQP